MKSVFLDEERNRIISIDFSKESLTITGDSSSSSISGYFVVNRFDPSNPRGVFITHKNALEYCSHLNKKYFTDTFIVISHVIFI